MIKYLIKFVSTKSHAEHLINGNLYMNAVAYYRGHDLERGQNDRYEGAISHEKQLFKNEDYYVYCMSAFQEQDIKNNSIIIDEKIISDFKCENGYLVLVKYDDFVNMLSNKMLKIDESKIPYKELVLWGLVTYGNIGLTLCKKFLVETKCDHFFIKDPYYKYQKEFRIIVRERAEMIFKEELLDGKYKVFDKYSQKTFSFIKDLRSIAQIVSINDIKQIDGSYRLNLNV